MHESSPHQPLGSRTVRRNIGLSAGNAFFVEGGMTLSQPSMVLTLFVNALGGSNVLIGLIPSLRFVGWLVPQFFAAGSMQRLRRYVPLVRVLEYIRGALYLAIAGLTVTLGSTHPRIVLGIFMLLFMLTRFTAGVSAVARSEIVARMVPAQERATVIALRSLAGGIAGLLSGIGVSAILDDQVSQFPLNYGLLIGISGLAFIVAVELLGRVIEPDVSFEPKTVDAKAQIRRAPEILRGDRRFALYVAARATATGIAIATPFYMLFATEALGAPDAIVGLYISLSTLARIVSNLMWAKLCKTKGNLWVMRTGFWCQTIATALAATLAFMATSGWQRELPTWGPWAFATVFLIQGLGQSAHIISRLSYLYDIAPEEDRPTYYGLANTLLGPLYFLPALGGVVLDVLGYGAVFLIGACAGLLAIGIASRLSHYDSAFAKENSGHCASFHAERS